ncbi:MAG: hypothetical protein DWQ06_08895 [Calditrichaeota bacterium]|nr:MAG: hypothetical protein DWQ06_08895 [Calditrichota bacterium]
MTGLLLSFSLMGCEGDKAIGEPGASGGISELTQVQITGNPSFSGVDSTNVVVSTDPTDGTYIFNIVNGFVQGNDVTARVPYTAFTTDGTNTISTDNVEVLMTGASEGFAPSAFVTSSFVNVQNNGKEGSVTVQIRATDSKDNVKTTKAIKMSFVERQATGFEVSLKRLAQTNYIGNDVSATPLDSVNIPVFTENSTDLDPILLGTLSSTQEKFAIELKVLDGSDILSNARVEMKRFDADSTSLLNNFFSNNSYSYLSDGTIYRPYTSIISKKDSDGRPIYSGVFSVTHKTAKNQTGLTKWYSYNIQDTKVQLKIAEPNPVGTITAPRTILNNQRRAISVGATYVDGDNAKNVAVSFNSKLVGYPNTSNSGKFYTETSGGTAVNSETTSSNGKTDFLFYDATGVFVDNGITKDTVTVQIYGNSGETFSDTSYFNVVRVQPTPQVATVMNISGPYEFDENSISPLAQVTTFEDSYLLVELRNADGNAVNNKSINFAPVLGSVTPQNVLTESFSWGGENFEGAARVIYTGLQESGTEVITITVNQTDGATLQDSIAFSVVSTATPASIDIDVSSNEVQVKGTGGTETITVQAIVYDGTGQPVTAGQEVEFSFISVPNGNDPLNDQPVLFTTNNSAQHHFGENPITSTTNNAGIANIQMTSGTDNGPISIRASIPSANINAGYSQIVITSGPPANIFVGYAPAGENIGGGLWKTEVSASVVDAYDNPVQDSTAVFFTTDENDFFKIIRRIPGTAGNPPVQCEVVDLQNPVSGSEVNIGGAAVTFNESPLGGDQTKGVAYTELTYRGFETNGEVWVFASAAGANGDPIIDSLLVDLGLNEPELSSSATQPGIINEAGACWTRIDVTANLVDGQQNAITGTPIQFTATRGRFTEYIDLDGWVNNCLYEVDPISGELDANSCYALNYQLLNPGKPLPNYPEDFVQPLIASVLTNSGGSATNTLVFACDDVDDPQQTDPPFPIISTENVTITVSVIGTGVNDQPPSITLTKQHYNPGEDPQSPADLKCRVGTCVNGASPWGSPFCFKSIVDPIDLTSKDLKRKVLDFRSREVFEVPDGSCTNWYTIGCGPVANLVEQVEAYTAK